MTTMSTVRGRAFPGLYPRRVRHMRARDKHTLSMTQAYECQVRGEMRVRVVLIKKYGEWAVLAHHGAVSAAPVNQSQLGNV